MAAVKSKDTTPEMIVRRLVHAMGYRFRLHVGSLPGNPDLVFPRLRKVIFVSGCFWHMHRCGRCRIPSSRRDYWVKKLERNATRDKRVQQALRRCEWGVMVVWECQTISARLQNLQIRLARFLSRPGT
jgi:DNA mismatch endonuclease (patch repair protein)